MPNSKCWQLFYVNEQVHLCRFQSETKIQVKFPVLSASQVFAGRILSVLFTLACFVVFIFFLPGYSFIGSILMAGLLVIYALYSDRLTGMEIRFSILVFAIGLGIFVVAEKSARLFGEFSFGFGLGPRMGETPVLSGLLWLVPVLFSFSWTAKLTANIYLRSAIGAVLVTVPTIFFSYNAPLLDFMHWGDMRPPASSFLTWFLTGFFMHFAGHQMQAKMENPLAIMLYAAWLLFHVALFAVRIFPA